MSGPPQPQPPPSWDGAGVRVHPGTGLVDRRGDTLLVVPVLPTPHSERVRELVELCRRPDPTGRARTHALRALLDTYPAPEIPGFALLVHSGHSLRVFVHQPVRVLVDGRALESRRTGAPGAPGATAEHVLEDGDWRRVTIAADEGTGGEPALPDVPGILAFDLESGTVPGAGVTLARVPAAQPPPSPAAQSSAVALASGPSSSTALRPAVQFRTVLLGECAVRAPGGRAASSPRPPLPVAGAPTAGRAGTATTDPPVLVEGVLCPEGHFTDPHATTCRMCGTALPPDGRRVSRPRPPLGILVTDGGSIYPVTGDFVIGREPERAPDVLAGRARPLPLKDAERSTSRVHAHLTLEAWQVLLRDGSSANGTFVSGHGAAGPWLPVSPQAPIRLAHGDRIRLGQRQLLFDTWRESVVPQVTR